jgi:hypothetical protein
MPDKTITGWLVVDWRNETHRTRKSKPGATDLGANEVLAKLNVEVNIPEVDVPTLGVAVDVPEPQVHAATLEALDDGAMPDWTDAAAEIAAEHDQRITEAAPGAETERLVDGLTTEVLLAVETRPPAERVREYVLDLVHESAGPEEDEP